MDVTIKNATINDIVPIFELNKKLINDYETSTNLSFDTIYHWIKQKIQNKDVFLYVFSKNKGAINLYLRNGFEITEDIHGSRYVMTKKVLPYN